MPQFNSKLFAKCQPCESILWKINSQEIFLSFLDLSLSKNHLSIYSQNVISHDIIFTHSLFYLMYDLNYTSLQDNFSLEELFLIHKKTLTMMMMKIQSPIGLYQISLKKYLFNSYNEFFILFESYCDHRDHRRDSKFSYIRCNKELNFLSIHLIGVSHKKLTLVLYIYVFPLQYLNYAII